ncbi:MAG: alanine racemase [bacterium]|nr:alanine racemase [bacterium]
MIVDLGALARNADAWRAFSGGRRIYAVVKADAYGIGTDRAVRALDQHVDGWCVTSLEEGRAVRRASGRRIICIAALPEEHVAPAVALGMEISLASARDVRLLERVAAEAGRRVTAQLAVRSVAGWIGVAPHEAGSLAREIVASRGIAVDEAWTHLSGEAESQQQLAAFQAAIQLARSAGLELPAHHVASTAPAIWLAGAMPGSALRIGIGLFGSMLGTVGSTTPALSQVIHVRRPIEHVEHVEPGVGVGYGARYVTKVGDRLATARFGYADGMPRTFVNGESSVAASCGDLAVVAMGMQFLTCVGHAEAGAEVEVLGPRRPIDVVATAAGVLPHELVLSLAHASRAAGTLVDSVAPPGYTTCGTSR